MTTQNPTLEMMPAVPAAVRRRIVSGMRWTFWLSALAVPFSYGTSILLARAGPEVIGTYGLLMVYIGIVASLFYFGGDAVVIKFIPALDREKRLSFLVSYAAIVLGFVTVGVAAAAIWPRGLHYLFGDGAGTRFQLKMLCLSPIYVMFSLVVAAHKAVLEMRWAHLLTRVLTIGSFVLYSLLYAGDRALLANHHAGLVWGIYLSLTALATAVGTRHLMESEEWPCNWSRLAWNLPIGFWHYTLSTEQVSAITFLLQRLDLILIMNGGGLAVLGRYVAILTVADSIRTANRFFVDTLLPSLTNVVAGRNMAAASQLVTMNLRLLLFVDLIGMGGLILLTNPILRMFGAEYADLRASFILLVMFCGLAAPGGIGGTVLSAVGKQHYSFWAYLVQIILFVALFGGLWRRSQLRGAILANGIAALSASLLVLALARWRSGLRFSGYADYVAFVVIGSAAGVLVVHDRFSSFISGFAIWIGSIGLLMLSAKYTLGDCKQFLGCIVPVREGQ